MNSTEYEIKRATALILAPEFNTYGIKLLVLLTQIIGT